MLTSLNLSAVFDTEDHHVLLTCLGDWQKWVSHPELDRSTPLSQISRLFWWVVSFQPWKLLIVWCYKDWFYLLFRLTQSFMRSLETTDFFSGNRSNQIPYFIPANTDGLVEGKKKKGLIVKKSAEWMKGVYSMKKTKDTEDLLWGLRYVLLGAVLEKNTLSGTQVQLWMQDWGDGQKYVTQALLLLQWALGHKQCHQASIHTHCHHLCFPVF